MLVIVSLLAEVSHDDFVSFLPRRERPLLAGKVIVYVEKKYLLLSELQQWTCLHLF